MKIKHVFAGIIATGTIATGGSLAADAAINPYTNMNVMQNGVSVPADVIAASSTIPEAGTVQTAVDTSQPAIVLSKWSGQAGMEITYEGLPATTTGSRPFLSKAVDWNGNSQSLQVVPLSASSTMEDGGMEINIILNSEPATNTFAFSVSGADDLDFFYQAPLWQEAGLSGPTSTCNDTFCLVPNGYESRPQNVVGSYAVYSADHADHVEGQTNYATGKVYQIFRPLVTDANGTSTWAVLSYSPGILNVTVPQFFLDNAAYPVIVDPTIGYTTAGATSNGQTGTEFYGSFFSTTTNATGGNVTDVQMFGSSSSGANHFEGAIYNTSNVPLSPQSASKAVTSSTAQWWVVSVAGPTLSGNSQYAPAIEGDGSTGNSFNTQSDTVSLFPGYRTFGITFGVWPNPATPANSTIRYSVYADYVSAVKFAPWQFSDF